MLKPSARIAVVAPSGAFDPERLARGEEVLRSWGHDVQRMPGCSERWRYLAGEDATRREDLLRAFSGDWDAVWMARGGSGLGRLLRTMPWETLAPAPFFGFSDGTALLEALAARGRPAIHAPVLTHLGDTADEASRGALRELLVSGERAPWPLRRLAGPQIPVDGVLRGGNLCVLASLCGTPWQLDARGAILVLEDIGEAPYKLDRLLRQLLDSGALAGARAIVLGEFSGAAPPAGAGWSLEDVFTEVLGELDVPVLAGAPVGHGARNVPFRLNAPASLEGETLRFGGTDSA